MRRASEQRYFSYSELAITEILAWCVFRTGELLLHCEQMLCDGEQLMATSWKLLTTFLELAARVHRRCAGRTRARSRGHKILISHVVCAEERSRAFADRRIGKQGSTDGVCAIDDVSDDVETRDLERSHRPVYVPWL